MDTAWPDDNEKLIALLVDDSDGFPAAADDSALGFDGLPGRAVSCGLRRAEGGDCAYKRDFMLQKLRGDQWVLADDWFPRTESVSDGSFVPDFPSSQEIEKSMMLVYLGDINCFDSYRALHPIPPPNTVQKPPEARRNYRYL